MNNYRIFNEAIHDHFFNNAQKGEYIFLCVDEALINTICQERELDRRMLFHEISQLSRNDWNFVFTLNKTNLPNFFGFIGIQIYAAHLMHSDNQYTQSAYNPRLCEQLQIELPKLQILYNRFQNKLWGKLKAWCELNGYYIHLPQKKDGKGCYIQYPISQALLNTWDKKRIPLLFEKSGLKPFEQLSFEDFNAIVSDSDNGRFLTTRYYKLKEQFSGKDKSKILSKQIYSIYLEWDGTLPVLKKNNNNSVEITERISADTLVLRSDALSSGKFDLFTYDENENVKDEFKSFDKFLFENINKRYRLFHKNLILFIKNDDDDEDWEETRFIKFNAPCLLLFKRDNNFLQDYLYLLDKDFKKFSSEFYSLYQLNIKEDQEIKPFYKFLFSIFKRPFSVQNGLKLARKSWLYGAGPDFVFENSIRAWLNGKEICIKNSRYSCKDHSPDRYTLKVADNAPFTFFIQEPHKNLPESHPGWHVNKKQAAWEPSDKKKQISGLNFYFPKERNISEHREWINAVLGRKRKRKNSNSLLIDALQRINQC